MKVSAPLHSILKIYSQIIIAPVFVKLLRRYFFFKFLRPYFCQIIVPIFVLIIVPVFFQFLRKYVS